MPACHAGGRGFDSRPFRHFLSADMAQLVERTLGKGEVPSSILGISTISPMTTARWFFRFCALQNCTALHRAWLVAAAAAVAKSSYHIASKPKLSLIYRANCSTWAQVAFYAL